MGFIMRWCPGPGPFSFSLFFFFLCFILIGKGKGVLCIGVDPSILAGELNIPPAFLLSFPVGIYVGVHTTHIRWPCVLFIGRGVL